MNTARRTRVLQTPGAERVEDRVTPTVDAGRVVACPVAFERVQ